MARKKAESKFLTKEELALFEEKIIARRGKKFYTFVSEVMGTAYNTIRNKFLKRKVEIAIRDNVERFFKNQDLEIQNEELKSKLQKVNDLTGEKK